MRTSATKKSAASIMLALSVGFVVQFARAHEGEDHGAPPQARAGVVAPAAAAVRTAERNVESPAGSFRVRLRQAPADPRTGEEVQFEIEVGERIEGGFGAGGGSQPIEVAIIFARITTASGAPIATRLEMHKEARADTYGVHHRFDDSGDYKLFFDIRTSDGREFTADFPVAVTPAPVNWTFWLGLAVLSLVATGATVAYGYSQTRDGVTGRDIARKTLPVAVVAVVFLVVGILALRYFEPPHERRTQIASTGIPPSPGAEANTAVAATGDPALGGSGATITIPKESQLLFGIRTASVEERQIVSGLKTTGTVRAKPDARAVISPPVAGRVTLNRNIGVGTVIGRGQTIGSVEQILGAPEQAGLESQRIGLRTAALEQQARASEQNALAQQARTRLTQARRELQRATNLLEVGAAPRRRVEEAQTGVRLAEQEVAAAEAQARIAAQQASLARESIARVNPVRAFPLVSPVSGIVTDLRVTTGQQVEAGAELLSVVNLTTVLIEAQVFEGDLAAARDSGRATYTASALGGEVYRIGSGGDGRLLSIGQTVDPQTRAVPVFYEVPNPLNRLRENMFVEITLDTSGGASVLTVPKASVITEQGRTFVFVLRGGEQFERRIVVLGAEGQDYFEVRSGLTAGERVVTEGIYQLRSTQAG